MKEDKPSLFPGVGFIWDFGFLFREDEVGRLLLDVEIFFLLKALLRILLACESLLPNLFPNVAEFRLTEGLIIFDCS